MISSASQLTTSRLTNLQGVTANAPVSIFAVVFAIVVALNSVPVMLEFEHMHAYKLGALPLGYLPFFFFLGSVSFLSLTSLLFGSRHQRQQFSATRATLKPHRLLPFVVTLPAIGLICYALLSSQWVTDQSSWAVYTCMWGFYLVCFWLLAIWIPNNISWDHCKALHRNTAYVTVATALIGILRFAVLDQPDANAWPLINRNGFVFFLVPAAPIVAAVCEIEKKSRFVSISLVLVVATACLLTFSRMGTMGLTLALSLYFLYPSKKTIFRGMVAIFIAGITFWLVAKYVPHVQSKVDSVFATVSSLLDSAEIEAGQLDYRRFILLEEAKAIAKANWLLGTGVGLENYLEHFQASMHPMKPHNLYLSYLAEFGIFGFASLMALLFGIFFILYRTTRRTRNTSAFPLMKAILCGHVAILFMFIFNEYITSPTVWCYWGIAIGTSLLVVDRIPQTQKGLERIK